MLRSTTGLRTGVGKGPGVSHVTLNERLVRRDRGGEISADSTDIGCGCADSGEEQAATRAPAAALAAEA